MRYIVIAVGCLECLSIWDDVAEVVLKTDDLTEATSCANENPYPGQEKRIILDTTDGDLIKFA